MVHGFVGESRENHGFYEFFHVFFHVLRYLVLMFFIVLLKACLFSGVFKIGLKLF